RYGYIYLQGNFPWDKDSLGLIFETDVYDDVLLEDINPELIKTKRLTRVMQISRAEDAIRNAFMQKNDVTRDELVACFNNHYENDGYLDLSEYRNSRSEDT
ncbi:MAG: hypothetical protein AAF126_13085, partial [Chloroflexota bacterium]